MATGPNTLTVSLLGFLLASEAGCDFDFLKGHCQDKNQTFYNYHPLSGPGAAWMGPAWSAGASRTKSVRVSRRDLAKRRSGLRGLAGRGLYTDAAPRSPSPSPEPTHGLGHLGQQVLGRVV